MNIKHKLGMWLEMAFNFTLASCVLFYAIDLYGKAVAALFSAMFL